MNAFVAGADVVFAVLAAPTCVFLGWVGCALGWRFLCAHAVVLGGLACAPLVADVVHRPLGWWRALTVGLLVVDGVAAWWQARRRARTEGFR